MAEKISYTLMSLAFSLIVTGLIVSHGKYWLVAGFCVLVIGASLHPMASRREDINKRRRL